MFRSPNLSDLVFTVRPCVYMTEFLVLRSFECVLRSLLALYSASSLARRYEERIQVLKSKMKEMADELDGKLDKYVVFCIKKRTKIRRSILPVDAF